jgi:hypothetical protein
VATDENPKDDVPTAPVGFCGGRGNVLSARGLESLRRDSTSTHFRQQPFIETLTREFEYAKFTVLGISRFRPAREGVP